MKRVQAVGLVVMGTFATLQMAHAAAADPSAPPPAPAATVFPTVAFGTGSLSCSARKFRLMNGIAITHKGQEAISGELSIDTSGVPATPYRIGPNALPAGFTEMYFPETATNFMSCDSLRSVIVRGTGGAFASDTRRSPQTYRPSQANFMFWGTLPDGLKTTWVRSVIATNKCGSPAKFTLAVRNETDAATFGVLKLTWGGIERKTGFALPVSINSQFTTVVFDTGLALDCTKPIPPMQYELTTSNVAGTPTTTKPPPVYAGVGSVPVENVYFSP